MPALRKFVLVTGCSAGGIGAALAQVFQEKGYHVFATARNPTKISQALTSAGNVTPLTLDVLSSNSILAAVDSVKKESGGRLDVLVNNSGGGSFVPALDASIEEGKKLFDLNFWAPLAMLQAFAPLLIQAQGCVVNNSSANTYAHAPFMSVYNGSKAALTAASETWRLELEPLGVRTITLVTCAVKSTFFPNNTATEIPEASYYYEIRDSLYAITDGRLQKGAISPRRYALKVIKEIENGSSGTVWAGTNAFAARLVWWLAPQWIFDKILRSIVPAVNEVGKVAKQRRG